MLRRSIMGAALVLCVVGSSVLAETYTGTVVKKLDDKEVTIRFGVKVGDKFKAKEITLKISKDTQFFKAGKTGSEPTKLTADDLRKAFEKGKIEKEPVLGKIVETKVIGGRETVTKMTVSSRLLP